jgi:anthranilate phosphoribosyltransferase
MASTGTITEDKISITPLLKRLWHESPTTKPTASEIAAALGLIFTNSLSEVQTGALLTCLHFTDLDRQAEILTECAQAMRDYSTAIDTDALSKIIEQRGRKEGGYQGGLVCLSSMTPRACTNSEEIIERRFSRVLLTLSTV